MTVTSITILSIYYNSGIYDSTIIFIGDDFNE